MMALTFQRFLKVLLPKCRHFSISKESYCNKWLSVSELLRNENVNSKDVVQVKGWVKGMRKMKELVFVDVNDGSCAGKLQVVMGKHMKPENLTFGSSLEASGSLQLNNNRQLELIAKSVRVIGTCDSSGGYPFAKGKTYPEEYVRQFMHFRPRHSTFGCVMRLRDRATRGLHDVLDSKRFVMVHTPLITANDCEGAGEVFLVSSPAMTKEACYFSTLAYLTVSGQLHLEAAVRGLSKVYTFGPVFRAENSRSRLHLSEFYMLEAELAFSDDLEDAMALVEDLIRGVALRLLTSKEDLLFLQKQLSDANIIESLERLSSVSSLPRVSYDEAVSLLGNVNDLNKEQELLLSEIIAKRTGIPFVFVTDWPTHLKPFYMKRGPQNQALAFDLIGPIAGEVCGGSVRESCPVVLEKSLREHNKDALQWYLDIRRHGNVPSCGFGLGFERILQSLLSISNIKDTLPFPRWPHHLKM